MSELFLEDEVRKALSTMLEPGAVFEVRALDAKLSGNYRTGIISGYFDNADACLKELEKLEKAKGIYITLNRVNPALLARRANRLDYAQMDSTTKDQHILRRIKLFIDVDAVRPSGVSATEQEKQVALNRAREIYGYLMKERGWPKPIVADSANGCQLVYLVDLPSEDDGLLEKVLDVLATRFDGDGVEIDPAVHNPSRIIKLWGTLACKGDNMPERPWRLSKILNVPKQLQVVTAEQLQELVDELLPKEPEKPKASASRSAERNSKPSKAEVRDMLAVIPKRPAYSDWIKIVSAVGDALSDADAIEVLNEWSAEESPGEYADKLQHRLAEVHIGTLIHLARQYGWTPPKPKVKVTSESSEETVTELTSLTSIDLTPYPASLSPAAFHGLAGEFVKRTLPYTESDEAALLFQFHTFFGNVIGRTAHMIADAAAHYCNTNIILVGPTSIARKGTAYRHALRIFGCVDENWTQNCIKHGVSSGEGIIFHVRDPIEKTVPVKEKGKFTGRYETVMEDHGVQDKRLMIVETEFASVLKVMERSGSTVSVVFRHMWDGDNVLSTLTKNSPVRATGAHGSVLGHITIEELRRLLTETEMANGFGNRFEWIAVHRRQELPENDELPAIADLVQRLHKSIEFAKTAGQLKRDDQARELWASVYHDLSEGKPGLFGAIIARAAPQVLRQSLHYALLDCSQLVRIEHLQAALECWRYCEGSARWIFQVGTGNRNADRILAALAAAGKKGLTKSEITTNVFNRNATKHEIDEALRLLHRLGLAFCKMEDTATRPAERWFYNAQKHEVYEESKPGDGETGDTSYSSSFSASQNASSADLDASSPGLSLAE